MPTTDDLLRNICKCIPHEMYLASLPCGSRQGAAYRGLEPLVSVGDAQPDFLKPAFLKPSEKSRVSLLGFIFHGLHGKYFLLSLKVHRLYDHHGLAGNPVVVSYLFVQSVGPDYRIRMILMRLRWYCLGNGNLDLRERIIRSLQKINRISSFSICPRI